MTFRQIKISSLFGAMAFILYGCPEPPSYPVEPVIEFKDFYVDASDPNVGYLSINFTDGDGDIGLTETQTDPPYDTSSYYHYNMYAEYYEYYGATDEWKPTLINGNDTLTFTFRVPDITPEGQSKALKGSIQVQLNFYRDPNSTNDSIKYRIKLIDRALNESAWIETPVIYKGIPL